MSFYQVNIPSPSKKQISFYLSRWEGFQNYKLQENALNKLFLQLCPKNEMIEDILLKVSTLNDFYSTNIFSVFPIAEHILKLKIDRRLENNDISLVDDIKKVSISGKIKNFYSFATKYCSHHKPYDFPIYDSYVDMMLRYFQYKSGFSNFKSSDLKDYSKFKKILLDFREAYHLDDFNLKQIDQYLWQIGKEYFPKRY